MTAVRTPLIGLALFLLTGCVIQRAQTAANAQTGMVGMSKEQVLACMGVPNASMAEGNTFTTANSSTVGSGQVLGSATRIGPTTYFGANATGASNTNAVGFATTRQRSCTINVVMSGGQVSRVNYSGPTGGVVTPGEQCAYAVQNCVR